MWWEMDIFWALIYKDEGMGPFGPTSLDDPRAKKYLQVRKKSRDNIYIL